MTGVLLGSATAATSAAADVPTISRSEYWVLIALTIAGVVLAGVIIIVARSGKASQHDPSQSIVRSWIAVALVFGLLMFCATAFAVGDSALRSTLFGGLVASVGSAVAYYFSSRTAAQAQSTLLGAAVQLAQGSGGTAPKTFTAAAPPAATVHNDYQGYQFQADGVPSPSYALGTGPLPDGLNLSADGTLSGKPSRAGNFPITVIAWNTAGAIVSPPVQITVNPAQ